MKAFKITIVVVLVAAMGFGLYRIIKPIIDPDPKPNPDEELVIPDGCDLEWDQMYIDSVYKAIPDGQFQVLKQRREEMTANYNNIMAGSPKRCKETVDLFLRNRYQSRFIQMAENEFRGEYWPHYNVIRDMNLALLKELSQGSEYLKKIKVICEEYGKVAYYNSRVKKQSGQRPGRITDHWNLVNAQDLIRNPPSASDPVDHTAQYESSRSGKVKDILYNGHVAFLKALLVLAREEIQSNPTESNYNNVFDTVAKEIEKFKSNAASVYGKGYGTVNNIAESLINQLKSYEVILN